jgi:hypothetical protein
MQQRMQQLMPMNVALAAGRPIPAAQAGIPGTQLMHMHAMHGPAFPVRHIPVLSL